MAFLIHGLDPARFARSFTLSDAELAASGALRVVAAGLDRMLGRADVAYVHVHYAKPGCFACSVTRPS